VGFGGRARQRWRGPGPAGSGRSPAGPRPGRPAGTGRTGCRTSGASLRRMAHSHPSAVALHEPPERSPSSQGGLVHVLSSCSSQPSGTPAHYSEWEGVGTDDGAHRVAPGAGRDTGVGGRGRWGTPPTQAAPQQPWAGTGRRERPRRRNDLVRDSRRRRRGGDRPRAGPGRGGGDPPREHRRRPIDGWRGGCGGGPSAATPRRSRSTPVRNRGPGNGGPTGDAAGRGRGLHRRARRDRGVRRRANG
jgi:hypothetical protein